MDSPDFLQEDLDELNDETFGCAEAGDWELEHEQFAQEHNSSEPLAPDADALPRFWETPGDLSFLWQPNVLQPFENIFEDEGRERGVDVEETLQKLVSEDETFDDPAILDISRKVCRQKSFGSALENILDVPSYPPAHANILGTCKDIWSLENPPAPARTTLRKKEPPSTRDSLNLMDILRRLGRAASPTNAKSSGVADMTGSPNLLPRLFVEGTYRQRSTQASAGTAKPGLNETKYSQNSIPSSTAKFTSMDPLASGTAHLAFPDSRGPPAVRPLVHTDRPSFAVPPFTFPTRLPPVPGTVVPSVADSPGVRPLLMGAFPALQNDLRASAMRLLLLNAQNRNLSPRMLQLFPPPVAPGMPVPILTPPHMRFVGGAPTLVRHPPPHPSLQFYVHSPPPGLRYTPPIRPVVHPVTSLWVQSVKATDGMGADVDSDEPFDPNVGSWMTRSESIGVLIMHLRPLMVSNPYVQDYYSAVRWLRDVTAQRSKQLANNPLPVAQQIPPVMHMPSPLSPENLVDSDHYHHSSLKRRFVVPLALVPALHRPQSPDPSLRFNDDSTKQQASSSFPASSGTVAAVVDISSSLGRVTRSNVYCPRVVVELSLASALASGGDDSELDNKPTTQDTLNGKAEHTPSPPREFSTHPTVLVKFARKRRLLLARIEWMYNLILHLDEVDVSLVRIVVQNEMRNRLVYHRQQLLNQLLGELFRSSAYPTTKPPTAPTTEPNDTTTHSPWLEILSIRKGIRLFASVLYHLPPLYSNRCLQEFLLRFHEAYALISPFADDCGSLLYPSLRQAVYQTTDIELLMKTCFPEVTKSLLDQQTEPTPKVQTLLTCKLGLSLVFCLLDTCARQSKPEDPSNFIRAAAYFASMATSPSLTNSVEIRPMESFPHLASIIPVYVQPENHPPLTSERLAHFCRLACIPPVNGSSLVATTDLPNQEPKKMNPKGPKVEDNTAVMNGVHTLDVSTPLSSLSLSKSNENGPASSPTPVAAM